VIDGQINGGKGWAVMGQTGLGHYAVFQAREPVGFEGGTLLTVTLPQGYTDGEHSVGRFPPVGDDRAEAGAARPARRRARHPDRTGRPARRCPEGHAPGPLPPDRRGVPKSRSRKSKKVRKPLPTDPKLVELRATLASVSKPVPTDPKLAQLRQDVAISAKQLDNTRLTGGARCGLGAHQQPGVFCSIVDSLSPLSHQGRGEQDEPETSPCS